MDASSLCTICGVSNARLYTKEDDIKHGYFNPELDELLRIPGHEWHIGRNLLCVRGNSLRGRKTNQDTLNIWYLDADVPNLVDNESLHGTMPTLVGDTWGEFIWKGPLVAVMKAGSTWDPRLIMDITLTGYRDQARGEPDLVPVAVPKTHPLFNLEGDDPFDIPDLLDQSWVAKAYVGQAQRGTNDVQSGLENPLARLLLLQTSVENGKWEGVRPWYHDPNIGSLLVVDRQGGDLAVGEVRAMCKFIQQKVFPLMTEERAINPGGKQEVLAAITEENLALFDES
ncbi:hypothetical protein EG329_000810 [Mollisiaceae sp. DMI_Dod_QoI]|nr:hypothetical protein EG329_000810 [Helotiales sp. DMI_Dod_QoI]